MILCTWHKRLGCCWPECHCSVRHCLCHVIYLYWLQCFEWPNCVELPPLVTVVTNLALYRKANSSLKWKKMSPEKLEIFSSMEGWVEDNILTFLKPVESLWQPQDFLPNPWSADEEFFDGIKDIRARAAELPDEYYVCLVGNMITEEALPTYQTMFNTFEGVRDATGMSSSPWARWTRRWTAEENRHGDVLNKYLYLSGRLDVRQIEKTIQYLIGAGMVS